MNVSYFYLAKIFNPTLVQWSYNPVRTFHHRAQRWFRTGLFWLCPMNFELLQLLTTLATVPNQTLPKHAFDGKNQPNHPNHQTCPSERLLPWEAPGEHPPEGTCSPWSAAPHDTPECSDGHVVWPPAPRVKVPSAAACPWSTSKNCSGHQTPSFIKENNIITMNTVSMVLQHSHKGA